MNDLRDEATFSIEEDMYFEEELLHELSTAIRREYDSLEYMLCESAEAEDEELNWSQIEMSEIPEEMLLLCPYCRYHVCSVAMIWLGTNSFQYNLWT